MSYIGQRPVVGRYIKLDQISSGFNGSNTGFSMTAGSQAVFPGTARNLLLSLGGVIQEPDTDFTISGSTLTFTTPPVANTTFFGVIYGDMQATGTPSDGTVLPASIASSGHFKIPQLTVNEDGADVDFRVEGDTEANLLFVDASADRAAIGTSSPDAVLHIFDNPDHGNDRAALKVEAFRPKIRLQDRSSSAHSAEVLCDGNALRFNVSVPSNDTTNLTERLRIDSSGNVGIGTASPQENLHILSSSGSSRIRMTSADGSDNMIVFGDTSDQATGAIKFDHSDNSLALFGFNNSERMRIDSSGNVGIGTTSPTHRLHVVGDGSNNLPLKYFRGGSGVSGYLYSDGGGSGIVGSDGDLNNTGLYFVNDTSIDLRVNGSRRLLINSSGNVGISTTSPRSLLDLGTGTDASTVSNTAADYQLGLHAAQSTGGDIGRNIAFISQSVGTVTAAINSVDEGGSDQTGLAFLTGNNSSIAERVRIDQSGNVGIGTTSPAELLHLQSTAGNTKLRLTQSGSTTDAVNGAIHFGNSTDGQLCEIRGYTSGSNNSGYLQFRTTNSGSDVTAMTINTAGSVGIGTASPTSVLHVDKGLSGAPLVTFHQLNGSSGADAGLEVETSSTGTYIQRWINSGTEHARITGAGLMGIGTAVPTCLLNVNTDASGTHTAIEITRTTHGTVGKFRNSTGALEIQSNKQLILSSDPAQGMTAEGSMIRFDIDGGEKARIDAGGRLLIGTTSVTGISSSGDDIVIGSIGDSTSRGITFATTNDGTIRWADAGDNAMGRIQYLNGSDVMTFHTLNTERFKIDGSGNIGVNVLDANGGLFQMRPYHNFDDDAADLATSASKATLRVRTSSNSSMSLYIGGLDDSIDSARPYLQVGNLSTGGATAFYDLYLCPFGGNVRTKGILPKEDNQHDLGTSDRRWDDVFATNGTINTSDRNEKNTIVDSDLGLSFINKLKPVSYKFNGKTRTHYGLIAQDIETVLSDISKSTTDFAGFIKGEVSDVLYTEDEPLPAGKNVGDVKTPGTTNYGLRYAEFIAPLIKAVQELSDKVAALEAA